MLSEGFLPEAARISFYFSFFRSLAKEWLLAEVERAPA
jgi:hypothetical protein